VWSAPPDETAATVRERFAVVPGGAAPRGLPGRSVASEVLGAVGTAGGGGAVGVQGDGPALLVDGDMMVKETYNAHPSTLILPPSARWVTWCTSQAEAGWSQPPSWYSHTR
jgi:hypothetical protein